MTMSNAPNIVFDVKNKKSLDPNLYFIGSFPERL